VQYKETHHDHNRTLTSLHNQHKEKKRQPEEPVMLPRKRLYSTTVITQKSLIASLPGAHP
jgi:hypothetical protein